MSSAIKTKATAKLSSSERRAAIIKAVQRVFSEKGFDGTTTRELADAAGVSEALLFKHFPNKEALFSAMQLSCCTEEDLGTFERLKCLPPSTSTLVQLVDFLVSRMLGRSPPHDEQRAIQNRLKLRSLAQDGEFARLLLQRAADEWVPKVAESLEAAIASGDAIRAVEPDLAGWFPQHLAAMITYNLLPGTPAVQYGMSREKLVERTVRFSLRGMGLEDDAIERHYNPGVLHA